MKRNTNLVTLSKEHHHVLLFIWKIKQGLKLGTAIERMQKYVLYFWQADLQRHFEKEKTHLFSLLDAEVVRECLDRQSQVEAYIELILGTETDKHYFSMLTELIEKLVRYEERVIFPFFENSLTEAQLHSVGQKLENSFILKDDDGFEDQFWTEDNRIH